MPESKEYEIVFESDKGFRSQPLPPPPSLGSHEVLVRPKFVGICGSDIYLMENRPIGALRLGHEWVGVVESVGPATVGLKVGDTVTSTGTLACFGCEFCQLEQTHFCDQAEYLSSDTMGALRSWMVIHQDNLVLVPGKLSQSQVIHEVIAVAEEAMRLMREQFKTLPREILILGGGPIGTMLALVAKQSGLQPLVAEKREHRCEAVKRTGIECIRVGQAIIDPSYSARYSLIADTTNDGYGDTGGFRHFPIFAKKGFVGLMIGKYAKTQDISPIFNRMGGKLVWMRGMPRTTLRDSVRKWNSSVEELASNYITEVFPVDRVADAFELPASRMSKMKTVIQLR